MPPRKKLAGRDLNEVSTFPRLENARIVAVVWDDGLSSRDRTAGWYSARLASIIECELRANG